MAGIKAQINKIVLISILQIFYLNFACAATFVVTNTNYKGTGSLRQAVHSANATSGTDTIVFSLKTISEEDSIIKLEGYEINITESLIIDGSLQGKVKSITLDGEKKSRIFHSSFNNNDILTLKNMTLTKGISHIGGAILLDGTSQNKSSMLILDNTFILNNRSTSDGGGIYIHLGNAIISNSEISDNHALGFGGAISVFPGNTLLKNSVVSANSSTYGGGIDSQGDILLEKSTVSNNWAIGNSAWGGGLHVAGNCTLNESTVSGNTISGNYSRAGGMVVWGNTTLNQSTVSGNSVTGLNSIAGGLLVNDIEINQSTITDNYSAIKAGGIVLQGGNMWLNNSILAGNFGGTHGNLYNYGYNSTVNVNHSLFGDSPTEINGNNISNIFINYANLGPLQNNGGQTKTHMPNPGSYALDSGSNVNASFFAYDQRSSGYFRFQNGRVDIGSIERQ